MKSTWFRAATLVVMAIALFAAPAPAGNLDPPGPPGPTMKTLDQIPPTWDQILPANDSTTPDGCNSSRFKCVMGGAAVLDKETGLVWEQSPVATLHDWASATSACQNRALSGRKGIRLPTIEELASLVDPTVSDPGPTLPAGHPFANVQSFAYWSGTPDTTDASKAWRVRFIDGEVAVRDKLNTSFVWCVRGGRGHDGQ